MAYISFQPSDYFNTKLYTGNGTDAHGITGVGFQPDFVWTKIRSGTDNHGLYDVIRGVNNNLQTNSNYAQQSSSTLLQSFDSDGFTVGTNGEINSNSATFASWNWKANGAGSANTDGSISSTVSANTTSGMSIIQYSGNGTAGATIGHGLGVAPKCVIIKRTDTTSNWIFGTGAIGFTNFLYFNTGDAQTINSGTFNNTAPSSSVITLGSWNDVNNASGTYVAYAFAEKTGFSKFGEYVGNGSTSTSPFIYTGFAPRLVVVKRYSNTNGWVMRDSSTSFNGEGTNYSDVLFANSNGAETNSYGLQLYSNGFGFAGPDSASVTVNGSGSNYIYMAFAEHPIVSSNDIPSTAR